MDGKDGTDGSPAKRRTSFCRAFNSSSRALRTGASPEALAYDRTLVRANENAQRILEYISSLPCMSTRR